ncbi:16S rRNA (guanine(527)-N(7))-methyltransferase RsmG [Mycoplasma sp. Pen4]|uniref:16S rRNA (guanine(527)-N(7))-methyltransferase RsmG n=1 Tax=Mycoplasma sp. Pen4 TaxID=640330 RepID=UPI001653F520|nr:16S rRNA (guanine(527)-N(7))-methyltransferase RsmG [Mycoplasma sp. Pen4]QNM93683.1 16S rRNA (guanine(527)-N(7))-methyltransferase RsmG [Mycoplasma sp. Pen4]
MIKKEKVQQMCLTNGWDFKLFEEYVNLIEEYNKVMNLTGFSGERLWEEGILESLVFMLDITNGYENSEILDIGAGAGFPSIPYVLTKPTNKVTIYEPIKKRVNFLNIVIEKLNLRDYVTVFTMRSEEQKEKNLFEIVTARAVADIRALLMSSFHLVKVGGKMALMKGPAYKEELEKATSIFKQLDYVLDVKDFKSEDISRENYIVTITKKRSTPKQFPYLWKDIKKQQ